MLETELRLGLPGGSICNNNKEDEMTKNNNGKRGFSETESTVDLKLNLSSTPTTNSPKETIDNNVVDKSVGVPTTQNKSKDKVAVVDGLKKPVDPAAKPPAKAQVVGWPPVRSFRKNIVTFPKKNTDEPSNQKSVTNNSNNVTTSNSVAFIKVGMDGAPYLRKIDLKLYKSYQDLSDSLAKMFSPFTIGDCGTQGMKDYMNESKLIDVLNGSEYVATYEDKDGDWMLVGDVPWPMFVESCKRLRIMKGSEATGLAPRAVER